MPDSDSKNDTQAMTSITVTTNSISTGTSYFARLHYSDWSAYKIMETYGSQ